MPTISLMQPIIQDSDDDDFDASSPTGGNGGRDEADKSTGSTGLRLRRPRSLIGTNMKTDGLLHDIQNVQHDLAATDTASIQLRTDVTLSSSPKTLSKRRETIRTYGSSSKRMRMSSHDAQFQALKDQDQGQEGDKAGASSGDHLGIQDNNDGTWDLPATLRDDFVQHDPKPMFSEPSSTVPDNTMTQQRIFQEALQANQSPVLDLKGDQLERTDSSIPWSTYLASETVHNTYPTLVIIKLTHPAAQQSHRRWVER